MSGLAFFNPHFLWGLTVLAIPLIIHFARRRQTVVLDFSTIRFMQSAAVHASRMRQLKEILLLINRLLLVLLLILLFAQPYRTDDPFRAIHGSNTAVYSWIDPTISMGYTDHGVSLHHEACSLALLLDSVIHPAASWTGYDGRSDDFISLRHPGSAEELGSLVSPLRHGPGDFSTMIMRFAEYRKQDTRIPVMVLFSDFQEKDSAEINAFLRSDHLDFPVICVSLAPQHAWNYSLTQCEVPAGQAEEVRSRVHAYGRALDGGAIVALVRSMRVGQETVTVPKDSVKTVVLPVSHEEDGVRGELHIMTDDPCLFDNTSYFVASNAKKNRVLIVSDDQTAFPLIAALQSLAGSESAQPYVRKSSEVTYDDLDSSDVIILNGIVEPTAVLASLCGAHALSPKLILFSPAIGAGGSGFTSIVHAHLDQPPAMALVQSEKALSPMLTDTVSTVWQGFPRLMDQDVAIYSYMSPISGEILLRLNNGVPLVVACRDSSHSVWIVCATPLGITEGNNLCETGFYVPFLDRVLRYGSRYIQEKEAVWIAGVPTGNPWYGARTSTQVFTATNEFCAQWDRQSKVTIETPGLYRVQPGGKPSCWIAVVADSSEGDCHYWRPEIPETQQHRVKVLDRNSYVSFIKKHTILEFEWLWLFLGLCLLTEIIVWKKVKF